MSELTDRLRELSRAAAAGNHREFYMSIPAQPKRDADLVLDEAAKLIESYESRLDAAQKRICALEELAPKDSEEIVEHWDALRSQAQEADERRQAAECRLDNILSAIRRCAGELEFDNFNVKGDPGGYCSECGRGASAGHDPLCWRRYAFVVERHVHDFKPSALLKGERVCACGEYRYDSE